MIIHRWHCHGNSFQENILNSAQQKKLVHFMELVNILHINNTQTIGRLHARDQTSSKCAFKKSG